MTIPHRTLRLKALEQERKWLEGNDDARMSWAGWEFRQKGGDWVELYGQPNWLTYCEYRYVEPPRTVTVYTKTGAVELPEPMREAPEVGAKCFFIDGEGAVVPSMWMQVSVGDGRLKDGNIFHTAEHAQEWADFQRMQRVGETK